MTDLYNAQNRAHEPELPTLESIVRLGIRNVQLELRVCLPCVIVALNSNFRADIKPLLQARYYAGKGPVELPILPDVPISMPSGQNFSVKYPCDVGDTGWAIFADRSLDAWLAGDGSSVDPQDTRTHDLTDAIFVPGLLPDAKALPLDDATSDLVIKNGTAQVRLERNGTFRIANQGQELIDLVGQLTQALSTLVSTLAAAQTITMLGPMPLFAKTQLELAQATQTIATLAANLNTLKGA